MPLTATEMLQYATVRLKVKHADGTRSSGTAFHFNYDILGHKVPVLVTNKHVMEGAEANFLNSPARW